MAQSHDEDERGTEYDSLADLLNAIAGKGWVGCQQSRKGKEDIGFSIGDHHYSRHLYRWQQAGSWTTGAGRGFTIYRANIDGYTVDLATTGSWPQAAKDAYIAVHGEDGRQAAPAEFSDGYLRLQDALTEGA